MYRMLICLAASALTHSAFAEEGMWLLNHPPKTQMAEKYGFTPDERWMEHVQLSSARLSPIGCSASFVSPNGLVMTNHHCANACVQQLSTAQKDYIKEGFYADAASKEVRCPNMEVNQLQSITDVTARIRKATENLSGAAYNTALSTEKAKIEKACTVNADTKCDVVTLYHGGLYHLYQYRRYQDVRLVFAPEMSIAFFGGDPDNFVFPRYNLDVSFLRVYAQEKPAMTEHYLKWSKSGAQEKELTLVTGHPGKTSRLLTIAQLENERDYSLPGRLMYLSELRGVLTEFQKRSDEARRVAVEPLFDIENRIKGMRGRREALIDRTFFQTKIDDEKALREAIMQNPDMKKRYAPAFDAIAQVVPKTRALSMKFKLIEENWVNGGFKAESNSVFLSDLFTLARLLVRAADERVKPNDKRLAEYSDATLPQLLDRVVSEAPIDEDLEIAMLSFHLTKLREYLGTEDALVKKILGKSAPDEVATQLVKGSHLKDLAVRKQLWAGGKAAIKASQDAMIRFALLIDGDARSIRKQHADEVDSIVNTNSALIAEARFAVRGTNSYPDATFTLRLSYGQVKGYEERGKRVTPFTFIGGVFDRATGKPPFDLPASWLAAKHTLNPKVPFNFVTTNDIIGGNSGSPMLNRKGEVVGLVFDGNLQSLGGEYGFDESVNRTIAVHSDALLEALAKVYKANRVLEELKPKTAQ